MNIHIETEINASADVVWEIIAHRYTKIDQWASLVKKSWELTNADVPKGYDISNDAPVVGRATATGLGVPHEFLTHYSDQDREFTFRAANIPKIMTYSQNNTKVIALEESKSLLSFDIRIELWGVFKLFTPILRRRMPKRLGQLHLELKTYAETGKVSEKKKKELLKMDKDTPEVRY